MVAVGHMKGSGDVVKKDLAIIRAIEVVIALVMAFVFFSLLKAGTLGSIGRFATDWYSQKVDGMFTISVIDTSIQLPHLDEGSLPIAIIPEPGLSPETSRQPDTSAPPLPAESAEDITTLSAT